MAIFPRPQQAVIIGKSAQRDYSFQFTTGPLNPEQTRRCRMPQCHGSTVVKFSESSSARSRTCGAVGIDLSTAFIDAATYLTARCGLSDRVTFQIGDALHTPFEAASFDAVFLHQVAMNIEDRGALYAEVIRLLKAEGRFATHDLVLRDGDGDVLHPTPWPSDASTSFLLRQEETRAALERAGFRVTHWSDDTKVTLDWLKSVTAKPQTNPLNASIVRGQDFPIKAANLAQSILRAASACYRPFAPSPELWRLSARTHRFLPS